MNTNTVVNKKISIKTQTLAAILAIASAVVFPQFFHVLGRISGVENALGELFLPMHFPIILAGLLAGPYVGAISGMLSPVISFYLTGMPNAVLLPFMIVELCVYGLTAGFLRDYKIPATVKVLITQILGRLIRGIVILLAVYVFSSSKINPAIILTSIPKGVFGIVLQLAVIPLITYRVKNNNV